MSYISHLECLDCGELHYDERKFICDECGGPLDVKYDYDKIGLNKNILDNRMQNFWKYKELLPVDKILINNGQKYSPLVKSKVIGPKLNIELYFKLDSENPTKSFKDRPVAVAVNKALERKEKYLCCASTGNLAEAVAHFGRQNGFKTKIYIPKTLGEDKKKRIRIDGVEVVEVDGSYDQANIMANQEKEAVIPNGNYRPVYKEGSKTITYELVEQLGWDVPDWSIFPGGSGALFCSAYKAFDELERIGLIENKVSMGIVQPETCSPIIDAITTGQIKPLSNPRTIAKSIAIGYPESGYQVLDILKNNGGTGWKVTDDDIVEGVYLLKQTEGISSQPVGGAVIAAIKKGVTNGDIKPEEIVVANITGHGEKTRDEINNYPFEFSLEKALSNLEV